MIYDYVTRKCPECGNKFRRWSTAEKCFECIREKNNAKQRKEAKKYPIRGWATNVVRYAVQRGDLSKLDGTIKCVDCGQEAKHYDHRDYLKPLEVDPVCRGCNIRRGPGLNKHVKKYGKKANPNH